jgi:deoxycytidylate deaminase
MKHQLTAVITDKRGRVLSIGQNSYRKTHPLMAHYANLHKEPHKVFLHAEVAAIVGCPDISRAHTISVYRTSKGGSPLLAKPCPLCMSAIAATPIKVINYTEPYDSTHQ